MLNVQSGSRPVPEFFGVRSGSELFAWPLADDISRKFKIVMIYNYFIASSYCV